MNWATILRNIFSNWVSYLVTALLGFFLAPFIVHSLGNTGYGLWTLVLSLTGYFGLLDLGIRSSVGRFVARYLALKDDENVNRTISSAFVILATGGVLALLSTGIVAGFLFGSLKVDRQFQDIGRLALLITGVNMACILPLSVFSSVLIALERYDYLSGITVVGELLRASLVVMALRSGHGLVSLALISLLITSVTYGAMAYFARSLYRPLSVSLALVNRASCRGLLGFGIYRFIWVIANQLIFYSDSVVIGVFLGAGSITYYAIAGSLINYGRTVVSLVTDTLYPVATRLDARQDRKGLQDLLILGTKISLIVALPLCIGFVFMGKGFIVLWMGKEYVSSALFLLILTIPQLGSMSQYVSALILAGMAKHKVLAYIAIGEGLANLALSIVLIRRIGLVGVAWGTVIPDLVCTSVILPLYTLRVLKLGVREYIVKAYVRPLICAAPVAGIAYWISVMGLRPSWPAFACQVGVIGGSYGILAFLVCLDSGQRTMVLAKLHTLLRREVTVHEA